MSYPLDLEAEFRPSPVSANWLSAPFNLGGGSIIAQQDLAQVAKTTGAAVITGQPSWTKPIAECTTEKECVDNKGYWYQDYGLFNDLAKQAEYCHVNPMGFHQNPENQKLMLIGGGVAIAAVVGFFLYKKMK